MRLRALAFLILIAAAQQLCAAPRVEKLANNLYAYISDNDHSSNSTFLVGQHSILVVDTGLDDTEGRKLLAEIRKISTLPIQFLVNTHYHPDHQGGNSIVGAGAIIISSLFTRERTERILQQQKTSSNNPPGAPQMSFVLAAETVAQKLTIFIDNVPVEIIAPGPGHTMGDVYVYFPNQKTIAAGDLYMTNSCPAMDQGDAANWVRSLNAMAGLPVEHFVPGHFDVGSRESFLMFRNYLADLDTQVEQLYRKGTTVDAVRQQIDMKKYQGFRQFPQFHATFADNAATIYRQLQQQQK